MPELPEVETIKRALLPLTDTYREVRRIEVKGNPPAKMLNASAIQVLKGQVLSDVQRRGKYLLLMFREHTLISHLAMTGAWIRFQGDREEPHDFLHIRLGKESLAYNDIRRFGSIQVMTHDEANAYLDSRKLGPEPLSADWDVKTFAAKLTKQREIKLALMDQSVACGVGNIYASEVLHRCKVHPSTMTRDLRADQIIALANAIPDILAQAVKLGGSTISDFRRPDGSKGGAQEAHRVYGRAGMPCLAEGCFGVIEKIEQKGRSTFFCPQCQSNRVARPGPRLIPFQRIRSSR